MLQKCHVIEIVEVTDMFSRGLMILWHLTYWQLFDEGLGAPFWDFSALLGNVDQPTAVWQNTNSVTKNSLYIIWRIQINKNILKQ